MQSDNNAGGTQEPQLVDLELLGRGTVDPDWTLADQLYELYQVEPVNGLLLRLEQYDDNEVEVVNLEAKHKNRGCGTAGMKRLVTLADQLGINLMLLVAGAPSTAKYRRLVDFYSRFGFSVDDCDDIMRREAGIP